MRSKVRFGTDPIKIEKWGWIKLTAFQIFQKMFLDFFPLMFVKVNLTIKITIKGFKMILDGELDHIAENDFYMKGGIEEVLEASGKE